MYYKKGIVYRIVCLSDPRIQYVGSTFQPLRRRWLDHLNCILRPESKSQCTITRIMRKLGKEDFKILPIKEYIVCAVHNKDNKHLRAYEQLWINKLKCINIQTPLSIMKLSKKQYTKDHKEDKRLYDYEYRKKHHTKKLRTNREYYHKNKERILKKESETYCSVNGCEKRGVYKKLCFNHSPRYTCGCGTELAIPGKIQHDKSRTHQNWCGQVKIVGRISETIICECGSSVARHGLTRHRKTAKHIKLTVVESDEE